jgi:desulfoferrodoxin-like iron-binding protein
MDPINVGATMGEDDPRDAMADYSLDDWEKALTINVGTAYICRQCANRVMVTRGGLGSLDLVCCGHPMEKVRAGGAAS